MSAADPALQVRRARPDELSGCLAVRREVFVQGQGVPEHLEVDGLDPACTHLVALRAGRIVGTARLRAVDGGVKAERVAVLPGHRGTGAGVALMVAVEAEALRQGYRGVHLHAQASVIGFYERLGYVARGVPFHEAGIPHLAMHKPLDEG